MYLISLQFEMAAKYIVSAIAGSFVAAWVCDYYIADRKIFGGKSWLSFEDLL